MQEQESKYSRYLRSVSLAAIAMAAASEGVLAQPTENGEDTNLEFSVDEIVVTAFRSNKPANAIPNTIRLIGGESLEKQIAIAPDLSSVLAKLIPGYSPSRQSFSSRGESFRGRTPLYLIDGIPQSNPLRNGSRSGFTVDPEAIARIEVIPGANAIQGLGATGGIINFVTKSANPSGDLEQTMSVKIRASDDLGGDAFGYRGYYSVSQKIEKFDFIASASYEHRGVSRDGDGNAIGFEPVEGGSQDSGALNFFGKFGYDIDGDKRLELLINRFKIKQSDEYVNINGDRDLGIPTIAVKGQAEGTPPSNSALTGSFSYTDEDFAGGNLSLLAYFQDFEGIFGGGRFGIFQDPNFAPIGDLYDQSAIQSKKFGIRTTYVRDDIFNSGVNIITGFDYLRDQTSQELAQTGRLWVPETTFKNYAPFIQLERTFFNKLTVSGGFRYEIAELDVASYTSIAGNTRRLDPSDPRFYTTTEVAGGKPSFDNVVYNIGAIVNVTDELDVFGNFSQGFTVPDVGRVLRGINEPGLNVGETVNLEPIIVDNTEFGISYTNEFLKLSAAYFKSTSELGSRLALTFEADATFDVQRERVEIDGFELSADVALSDEYSVGGTLSIQSGKSDSDGDDEVDLLLDGNTISPNKMTLYAEGELTDKLGARAQITTFFDKDYDPANTRADFVGYSLLDVSFDYESPIGTVTLSVENVTDKFYLSLFAQTFGGNNRQIAGRIGSNSNT
ncbi:MAG: TonB-dependent receptor [Kordiimonadaceae bacterium]|nr:TonB-dependent receptor [Kordiimonadaceae bacterium]